MSRVGLVLAALSLYATDARAQPLAPVDGWIADARQVGVTFDQALTPGSSGARLFVAEPLGADPDRVVLMVVGRDAAGRTTHVGASSLCPNPAVRAVIGPRGTCLAVDLSASLTHRLLARPLAGPSSGTLRARVRQCRVVGAGGLSCTELAGDVPIRARRVALGPGARFAPGQRELFAVETPGAVSRASLWAELSLTLLPGPGGGSGASLLEVLAYSWNPHSGAMGVIREHNWSRPSSFVTIWAAAPHRQPFTPIGSPPTWPVPEDVATSGQLRIVRNDRAAGFRDADTDGLGTGLEAAIGTCDRRTDVLRFGAERTFRCSTLPGHRRRDTDQDGLTDLDEVIGRAQMREGGIPRWGVHPAHRDLLVEIDWVDRGCSAAAGCPADRSACQDVGGFSPLAVGRRIPEHVVPDFAAERRAPCPSDPRGCVIPEWLSPDGTPGVQLHLDVGNVFGHVADPFDPHVLDLGGGGCIPCDDPAALLCGADHQIAYGRYFDDSRDAFVHYSTEVEMHGNFGGRSFAFDARPGVFDQEIGHSFGLGHHGPNAAQDSRSNFKPNYFSRMNYRYSDAITGPGVLLYSTGLLSDSPVTLGDLVECAPFGERDVSFLDVAGTRPSQLLVCDDARADRADCVTGVPHADIDFDGDGRIGPLAPDGSCERVGSLALARSQRGDDAHTTRFSPFGTGHLPRCIRPALEYYGASAARESASAALRDDQMLVAYVDGIGILTVGASPPLTDENCPTYPDTVCWQQTTETTFTVIDANGELVFARTAAIFELRGEPPVTRTLIVYQPERGPNEPRALFWGFITPIVDPIPIAGGCLSDAGWMLDDRGPLTILPSEVLGRPTIARDPATGEILVLALHEGPVVLEHVLDDEMIGWTTRPAGIDARGSIGLAAWRDDRDPSVPSTLFAAYADRASGEIRFVERTGPGGWAPAARNPFAGILAERNVSLGVNARSMRLWAIWAGSETTLFNRSVLPEEPIEALDAFVGNRSFHEWGAAALLYDDRGAPPSGGPPRYPGALSGFRAALHAVAPCDRCYTGATSHGCDLPYCVDEEAGGFVFTQLFLFPFFDPTEIRVQLSDYNDYPTASAGICRFVAVHDGDPDRCPGLPTFSDDLGTAMMDLEVFTGPQH